MQKLILIKHAAPQVEPDIPSDQWRLSDRGRQSCTALAEKLKTHSPSILVSSIEAKAVETAKLVAETLGVQHETAADLHEHDRSNVPHMRSSEFISAVELFFRRPTDLTLGRETAEQALSRIATATEKVIAQHAGHGSIGVVTHGTVLALFLAKHANRPAFALWRQLGLPSFAVLNLPDYRVVEIVAQIA